MGLFGNKSDEIANQAEMDRLDAMSLEELGAEVLPHIPTIELGPLHRGPTTREIMDAMAPSRLQTDQQLPMLYLVAEGLQVLEHAGLVRLDVRARNSQSELEHVLTRSGRVAIDDGDVITRLRRPAP
jgi:hypothetical protein